MENGYCKIELTKVKEGHDLHYKESLYRLAYQIGKSKFGGCPVSDDWEVRKMKL